jgi:hypothetical protein
MGRGVEDAKLRSMQRDEEAKKTKKAVPTLADVATRWPALRSRVATELMRSTAMAATGARLSAKGSSGLTSWMMALPEGSSTKPKASASALASPDMTSTHVRA